MPNFNLKIYDFNPQNPLSQTSKFKIRHYFIFKDLNKEKPSDSDRACAAPRDSGKQAEIAFRLYDKDKDGYITKVHLKFIQ